MATSASVASSTAPLSRLDGFVERLSADEHLGEQPGNRRQEVALAHGFECVVSIPERALGDVDLARQHLDPPCLHAEPGGVDVEPEVVEQRPCARHERPRVVEGTLHRVEAGQHGENLPFGLAIAGGLLHACLATVDRLVDERRAERRGPCIRGCRSPLLTDVSGPLSVTAGTLGRLGGVTEAACDPRCPGA